MRNYALLSLLLVSLLPTAFSQNKPNGSTRPTVTPVAIPGAYTNPSGNYVRVWEPSIPTTDANYVSSQARTIEQVKQSTRYFDGFGRLIQTVAKGMSGRVDSSVTGGKDVVTMQIYDDFGREQYQYMPYVQQGGADGSFKTNPFIKQDSFYRSATLNPGIGTDVIFYAKTDFEASPLNRVTKTYAPGNNWANKPIEYEYLTNTAADSVRIWDITASAVIPTSASGRIYPVGELLKNVVKDEAGNQVIEYKDKEGQVVLKKVQLSGTPQGAHIGWLCTYYVYDYFNNLRFVLSPRAVELVNSTWVISAAIANELCFQYEYDGKRRLIRKRVPGAGPVEMVYDIRDRLVFTQDSVQRAKTPTREWLVTFYDELNRPVMTALYPSNSTRAQLQTTMNGVTSGSSTLNNTVAGTADLVLGSREVGVTSYKATNSIVFQDGFESETNASFEAEIDGALTGVTNTVTVSNPLPGITGYQPLTYTFYDDYSYSGKLDALVSDLGKPSAGGNPYAEVPTAVSSRTRGLVTGTTKRVLGTNDQWLTTSIYYDDKGRVIQTVSSNHGGGKDISSNLYDFNGKLLSNYLRHTNLRSGSPSGMRVLTMHRYDVTGKLLTTKKRLNDLASTDKLISQSSYDDLGQTKEKRLGVTSASEQLEKLSYEYNIRGWLKSINKAFVNTSGSTGNWFGQDLSYDFGFETNQYNGNIAGVKWKSISDGVARAYGFAYDKANRLLSADFNQLNTPSATDWTKNTVDFSVHNLAYDVNGNILRMKQMGLKSAVPATIDQMRYEYYTGTNRLRFVRDSTNDVSSTLGDFKEPTANNTTNLNAPATDFDYTYDVNGNLMSDKNKDIASISYNHLNLPQMITITGKGTIAYQYDAAGIKLKKTVTDNTVSPAKVTTTDYIGGFIYEQDSLRLLAHEEGRIRTVYQAGEPLTYEYDYFIKDHLGNVRMVLTQQTDFSMYMASMEPENSATENALFSNIENTRVAKPAGYPEDEQAQNGFVAKLNAKDPGKRIGPSLVLKVMAGDTVGIGARAFYKTMGPKESKEKLSVTDIANALVRAFSGNAGVTEGFHGGTGPDRNTIPFNENFVGSQYQRLKERDNSENVRNDRPRAYLNFVLFDEQFNMVEENSGVWQVKASPDELQTLGQDKMVVAKSGFLYVYTSNESQQDVFFDNVILTLSSGALLEETHYYPFGLTMKGISSKAIYNPENKYGYNGKELQNEEFSNGSGLEWYDYGARMYDPQIGRWHVIDSLSERHYESSVYGYVLNNPIRRIDIQGLTDWDAVLRGAGATVSGLVAIAGGTVFVFAPTPGVSQVLGGMAITAGISTTGLGITSIIAGFKDNGSADKIPGGIGEVSGMAIDKVVGNGPKSPVGRIVGSWSDLAMGLAFGMKPPGAIEAPSIVIDLASKVNDIENLNTGSTEGIVKKITNSFGQGKSSSGETKNKQKETIEIPFISPDHEKIRNPDFLSPFRR